MLWKEFICGGLAGMTAETVMFPLDRMKILFQMKNTHKKNMYRGFSAGLLRQSIYSSFRMPVFTSLTERYGINRIVAGGVAGAISCFISNPVDTIKVRFQNDTYKERYPKNVFSSLIGCFRKEGFQFLYRGLLPNIQRSTLVTSAEMSTYTFAKESLLPYFKEGIGMYLCYVFCGFAAGLCATIVSAPVDMCKTRLMHDHQFKGMVECLQHVYAEGGVGALYRGFFPMWFRIGPWCMMMFPIYEFWKKTIY